MLPRRRMPPVSRACLGPQRRLGVQVGLLLRRVRLVATSDDAADERPPHEPEVRGAQQVDGRLGRGQCHVRIGGEWTVC